MTYQPQTWINREDGLSTPLSAERLNHMEQGIAGAHQEASDAHGTRWENFITPRAGVEVVYARAAIVAAGMRIISVRLGGVTLPAGAGLTELGTVSEDISPTSYIDFDGMASTAFVAGDIQSDGRIRVRWTSAAVSNGSLQFSAVWL